MKSEAPNMTDWVSTKEAGVIVGCNPNTIVQMVHRGNLPNAVMVGHSIMIPLKDIREVKEKWDLKKANAKHKYPDRSEVTAQN